MPTASLADMTLKPVRGLLKRVACSACFDTLFTHGPQGLVT